MNLDVKVDKEYIAQSRETLRSGGFEYGEAIPWFKLQGNADQIKSSWNLNKLLNAEKVEILEILKYENKKWIKIK